MSEPEQAAEARRWLEYAQEDLASAAAMVEGVIGVPRQACWLAQQAVEKALKSVLVFLRVEFARTHDLDVLRAALPKDWRKCFNSREQCSLILRNRFHPSC